MFRYVTRALTVFALLSCALTTTFAQFSQTQEPKQDEAAPLQIAEMRDADIQFWGEDFEGRSVHTLSETISVPEASYIKVHFDYFNLPDGVYVEISNPEGTEVYTYDNTYATEFTVDEKLGQDGVYSFSSMSISSDTAIVTLHNRYNVPFEKEQGIVISSFTEGYSLEMIELLYGDVFTRSTCGGLERVDVACFENNSTYSAEIDRARPVARLVMSGGLCTAWRVSDQNYMFTNNHCMSTQSAVSSSEVWFNYQRTGCGSGSTTTPTKVSGATFYKTDYTLDYTLFSVNSFSSITSYGNLGLDVRTPNQGEEIYIPQHGSGDPKQLSIEDDQSPGNVCQINQAVTNGRGTNTDAGYYCDTIGGSSGSPVLARNTHKVIALHHLGGCTNKGALIDLIWPQVASYFNNTIPQGDYNTGGNNPPSASFSISTNGLTVNFTDNSSDSDGTVVSRSWNFGDGATSTSTNPSHTYSAGGTYNVTLTVTDNDGATSSTSSNISVSGGGTGSNELSNGVPVNNLSASQGGWLYYTIDMPAGASNLSVNISGGSGDADLYLRFGAQPTTSTYDCRPYRSGNTENCGATSPQTGTYHVGIRAYSSFAGVSLVATWDEPGTGGGDSISLSNLSGSTGNWDYYTIEVASGESLSVETSGGSGDVDLYVRFGSQPTTNSWDYRPYRWGNDETVSVSNATPGTWHIGLRAYSSYSGVSLEASSN